MSIGNADSPSEDFSTSNCASLISYQLPVSHSRFPILLPVILSEVRRQPNVVESLP
jgi:hypothetical protein